MRNTPGQLGAPGVLDLPGNDPVIAQEDANLHFSLGGQWLFKTKNDRMFPYLGFALPFDYASAQTSWQFARGILRICLA